MVPLLRRADAGRPGAEKRITYTVMNVKMAWLIGVSLGVLCGDKSHPHPAARSCASRPPRRGRERIYYAAASWRHWTPRNGFGATVALEALLICQTPDVRRTV